MPVILVKKADHKNYIYIDIDIGIRNYQHDVKECTEKSLEENDTKVLTVVIGCLGVAK